MTQTAGLRELRQHASDLVNQAEAGETIVVTVSGREVAELGPVRRDRWRSWVDVQPLFDGPSDPDWHRDRDAVDTGLARPLRRMRTLLDTSVLIGPPPAPLDGELAGSAISLAGLHFGLLVASSDAVRGECLRRLGTVERTFDALPVDAVVARHCGRLAAAVVAAGRQPRARVADLLIAATAVAHGARLCTRNPGDLAGLEEHLEVLALP